MKRARIATASCIILLVGCTQAAPEAGPTPEPTMEAAATRVMETAVPAATAAAQTPVQITNARISTTDSTITLRNTGTSSVDLSGWTLVAGESSVTLPLAASVAPGETLTIHTASGTNSQQDVYLGEAAATLAADLRPGARLALVDSGGNVVSEFSLPQS